MRAHRPKPKRKHGSAAAVAQLELDDFDDVQYKAEMVRTFTAAPNDDDDDSSSASALELAFLALVFLGVLGGCVLIGFESDVALFSRGALQYALPIALLPLAFVLALHVWERASVPAPHLAPRAVKSSMDCHEQPTQHPSDRDRLTQRDKHRGSVIAAH